MTSARDSASRLRQTLNPLRTSSLSGFQNQVNTPQSAITLNSPYSYSSAITPSSSVQRYNPQEWGPSPPVAPERNHQQPPVTSHEGQSSPLPPPPYSPPRSQRPASGIFETTPTNVSTARVPATTILRPSPEPPSNQNFPPPPNAAGRGPSRERRFGLPSLSRRRDTTESTTSPNSHPPIVVNRVHPPPQPLSIHVPQLLEQVDLASPGLPPGSRRSASASAIDTPTSSRSRSASQSRWAPGMPLPPPPPGPPPVGSRSQSLNRTISEPVISPPTRRPPPGGIAALGPVPPTPANWVDDDNQQAARVAQSGLTLDTSSSSGSSGSQSIPDSAATGGSPSGGLARAGAVRGEKTLRERRNESRTRHTRGDSSGNIQPLSDILVPTGGGRMSVQRGTPRSGGRTGQDTPWSGQSEQNMDSRNSTPRPSAGLPAETSTPPFSPQPRKAYAAAEPGQALAPKALPTPPPQSRSASSASITRPELHNSIGSLIHSATPQTPMSRQQVVSQTADQFCKGTVERFQAFAKKEAAAATDADRVKLFADFIVNESRLRRERYNSAIGAMGSEIFDLTRDLFRPIKPRRDSSSSQTSEWTPQVSEARSHRNSLNSIFGREPGQHSASAPSSAAIPMSPTGPPPNANWTSNYMPSLSPILSMSVSEAPDDRDSRGRPASRWWEADSVGESSQKMERSKRESKYMGVPKEAREALQWRDPPNSADAYASSSRRDSSNEYPPEKVGWHEPEKSSTPQPLRRSFLSLPASTPNTPSPTGLDVSRLVTLPPPYPRHHPAVNNSHPELTEIRAIVRTLSDMKELQGVKEGFTQESQKLREAAATDLAQRRQALRINLQQGISSGNMSYAEAASIEADMQQSERSQSKEVDKKDFERFQNAVVMPLNELLTARIAQATSLFDELRSRLFVETNASDPNMPQEEGDEQPELLEKLTLLKWIFEAREMLYREVYELLSNRNDRYKDMVLRPYQQTGNEEKLRNAEAFFAEDADKRRLAFAGEVLQRTREFRGVVGETVERGVDMQLNAFWDIAPLLKRLLDKMPPPQDDLDGFRIQIPALEYDENPSYHQHPLQYLFSLLLHTEKSTYQFIESQTNLLCLLHEVKEAVMGARAKVREAEGKDLPTVEQDKKLEQERLSEDLKEKVRVVRGQWDEGLGDAIKGVKERLGEWLLSTGGWDESLEDEGVRF